MGKIDFEKILIKFLNSPFNKQFDEKLKSALEEQGLEYKDGEIVKTQRRIAAEAKEAIFDNEDEKIRKDIIHILKGEVGYTSKEDTDKYIAWLEKQEGNLIENGYTSNKDFIRYADNYSHEIWQKLMDNFKNIKGYYIGCNDVSDIVLNAIIDTCNWLEKQSNNNQNWKPSKEQIHALEFFVRSVGESGYASPYDNNTKLLKSLMNDLYKLHENQSGQEPDDKTQPKFKVGDWIVHHGTENIYQVVAIIDNQYQLKYGDNYTIQNCADVDKCARLWDAEKKELKNVEQKTDKCEGYCEGCNNVKGCVTCVDGDQWAHYKEVEQKPIGCSDMATMLKKAFGNVGKKTWGGIEVKDILTWLEIQDSQKPTTVWHDVSEIPYLYGEEELLVECEKDGNTRNYVVKYDINTRQFLALGIPIDDVTRWAYVSDILTQSVTKTSDKGWSEEDAKMFEDALDMIEWYSGKNESKTRLVSNWLKTVKERLGGK